MAEFVDNVKSTARNLKNKFKNWVYFNEDEIIIAASVVATGIYSYCLGSICGFGKGFNAGRKDAINVYKSFTED